MEKAFTQYSLKSGVDLNTTIRLPKITSDMLSSHITDMHGWLVSCYLEVGSEHPKVSSRMKGNLVREIAYKKCVALGGIAKYL